MAIVGYTLAAKSSDLSDTCEPTGGDKHRMKGKEALNRARQAASLIRHPMLDVYSVEGVSNCGHLRLLVGDDGSTLDYITSLLFSEGAEVSRMKRVNVLRGPRLDQCSADVVVVGANLLLADLYVQQGFYLVPKWVRLFLPVEEDPYIRLHNFGRQTRKYFKWMLKKIQDARFECEVVTDAAWLDTFYYDMYCPYARQRFGDSAVVHSHRKVRETFRRGAGIVVRRGARPVAGTVVSRQGPDLRVPHVGVLEGDTEAVRDGALFAMDYYAVQFAHTSGCKFVDFGHSRPFLSDGPLRYKLNWHMEVRDDDDGVGVFAVATPGDNERAARFLQSNPFFRLTEHGPRLSDEHQ